MVQINLTPMHQSGLPALQGLFGADLRALHTQDALRAVATVERIVRHVHIHRANLATLTARDALVLIAGNAHKRPLGHGL